MNKIYLFNAGHEAEVLNSHPSYTSPARITRITKDFSVLPMWYADVDDFVLVNSLSDIEFYETLKVLGFNLPHCVLPSSFKNINQATFVPWGISRQILSKIENLSLSHKNLTIPKWNNELLYLNNRQFSIDVLTKLKNEGLLADIISIPQVFKTLDDFLNYAEKGNLELLVKAPYSSSGIGLLWIRDGIKQSEEQILKGFFKRQGSIVVEQVYNKVLDIAFEFVIDENRSITFSGVSLFQTNWKGAYIGNILKSQEQINYLLSDYISLEYIELVKYKLNELVLHYCSSTSLTCIGVDMMIIEKGGQYYLHPCVEINPRFNMGFLAIKLFEKYVTQNKYGQYIVNYGSTEYLRIQDLANKKQYPLIIEDGRIQSGYLSLTPITDDTTYNASIIIS